MENAWKLVGNGHSAEAIQILKQVIRHNPGDADAHLLLGSLLSEEGHHEDAVAELTQAVRLRPRSAEAQNALGEAYTGFGDRRRARHAFEQALAVAPNNGVAQLNLGRNLLESGEYDSAAAHLDRAVELLPHDLDAANAFYLRAKVYTARDQPRQAVQELQRAIAIHEAFPEAWSDLGQARVMLLDHAGALEALRRAVELAPNDPVAQYRLGLEYLVEHQPEAAIVPLRQAYRLNPTDQSIPNALLKALRQTGHTQEADQVKQHLAEILHKREISAENELQAIQLNDEGVQLQRAGDLRGAVEKYSEAVRLSPGTVAMRVNYAVAMLRLGQWKEGLNELHESLLLDPTNDKIRAALKDALAQAPPGTVPDWGDKN